MSVLMRTLNDYEESEFLTLVEKIWNVETDKPRHDALIAHFDSIVGHPAGSDLLFGHGTDNGSDQSPQSILYTLKAWHRQQGRAAFKHQVLPAPPGNQSQTREQRAAASSMRNLEKVRKLAADIEAAEQFGNRALLALEQQLNVDPSGSDAAQQLVVSVAALQTLETVQHQASRSVDQLKRLQQPVKFAIDGAMRDVGSVFLDATLQAVVLQEMTAASQRHGTALSSALARHPALYARGVTLIESLEARIAVLAQTTLSGPGYGPLVLKATAYSACLYPALLTARGLNRETATLQHHLNRTFRSAVAELEWQKTSSEVHPGTYADVLQFVLTTPSDDPRFAVTVPLAELGSFDPIDWVGLASAEADVAMPFRLCSASKAATHLQTTGVKPFSHHSHIYLTTTQGPAIPATVRVRLAHRDVQQRYIFTSDDSSSVTVIWENADAAFPPMDLSRPPVTGFIRMPPVPQIEPLTDLTQVRFDDYIVVFPADSGMPPLYIMFRDRRELTAA